MDRNLGAIQVATSSDDTAAYGDMYQWGRATEGHENRTSTTTLTKATTAIPNAGNSWDGLFIKAYTSPFDWLATQDNTLWQGISGTNNPCPSGFRLPTEAEWNEEKATWSSQNAAGAFGSVLKLTTAGYRFRSNGSIFPGGHYRSSTVSGIFTRCLRFDSSSAYINDSSRADGQSVRCIKN